MNQILNEVGQKYGSYELKNRYKIDELGIVLKEIEHTPSSAKILHIESDDPENLFCISFKTHPDSSDGVAHILEHTVLCGSKKYPVKDPFFAMQKRSLNTFMNALTGSDFTCYPASSLNKKDFYNLLEVYIDAVFHPLLLEKSFLQEGHRLEFAKSDDVSSSLEIKGIVYNEMKGSMSSTDSRLWHTILAHLTPDLPYAHNSGGEPKEIAHLSYQKLKDFFNTFYHPSRAIFYFYGNFPINEHLDFLEDKILKNTDPLTPIAPIAKQTPFKEKKVVHMEIPAPKSEDAGSENVLGFGYLTAPIENQLDVLALCLLDSYLMDTDTSILKKALLDSELCDNIDSYLDPEMSEIPYVIFCRGVNLEDHETLEKVVLDVFKKLADEGTKKSELTASLHQLELARTEISGDGQPFGLTLFMRSALAYQHGVSPDKALIIHKLFDELEQHLEDPRFLANLIKKYFVSNHTQVKLIAKASSSLLEKEAMDEKTHLQALKDSLSENQKHLLTVQAKELNEFQKMQEHQNIECLPKISLDDVKREVEHHELMHLGHGLYGFEGFTNGMFYADCILNMHSLTEDELSYLPLLAAFITELGHKDKSYEHTLADMHLYTGGISASCGLLSSIHDKEKVTPVLTFKGKALKRNIEPFLKLLHDCVYNTRFDELKRLEELVNQLYSTMQNKFPRQAIRYASQLALSGQTITGKLNHLFYGLPFYEKVKSLKMGGKEAVKALGFKLQTIFEKWKKDGACELLIVADTHIASKTAPLVKDLFKHLKPFSVETSMLDFSPKHFKEAHIIPASVAFNVKSFNAPSYLDPNSSHLLIGASLLENVYLHNAVREIGGAYGVGCNYISSSGAFYFHSYRDPKIAHTFEAFKNAQIKLCHSEFSEKELQEAKICIIQHLDTPMTPLAKAITSYTYMKEGRTKSMRQGFRDKLLDATVEDIKKTANLYLNEANLASYVSFCGLDVLKKEEELLKKTDLPLAVIPL